MELKLKINDVRNSILYISVLRYNIETRSCANAFACPINGVKKGLNNLCRLCSVHLHGYECVIKKHVLSQFNTLYYGCICRTMYWYMQYNWCRYLSRSVCINGIAEYSQTNSLRIGAMRRWKLSHHDEKYTCMWWFFFLILWIL